MVDKESTALATQGTSGFAIVDDSKAKGVMLTAFEQLGISNYQLNRLKIPAGGGSAWEVESLEGTRVEQNLDVIVLAIKGKQKSWWSASLDEGGGGSPPSCSSTDGRTGFGVNTLGDDVTDAEHACSACEWNQFGSSRGSGNGKDCKDFSLLFCFLEGSRLPSLLTVPATSLKGLQGYVFKLIDSGKRMENVITRLSLKKTQSASGITYSTLDLSWVKDLDEGASTEMTEIHEAFSARLTDFDNYADRIAEDN